MRLIAALALAALLLAGCRKTIREAKADRPTPVTLLPMRAPPAPVILRYSDGPLVPCSETLADWNERSFAALRA